MINKKHHHPYHFTVKMATQIKSVPPPGHFALMWQMKCPNSLWSLHTIALALECWETCHKRSGKSSDCSKGKCHVRQRRAKVLLLHTQQSTAGYVYQTLRHPTGCKIPSLLVRVGEDHGLCCEFSQTLPYPHLSSGSLLTYHQGFLGCHAVKTCCGSFQRTLSDISKDPSITHTALLPSPLPPPPSCPCPCFPFLPFLPPPPPPFLLHRRTMVQGDAFVILGKESIALRPILGEGGHVLDVCGG